MRIFKQSVVLATALVSGCMLEESSDTQSEIRTNAATDAAMSGAIFTSLVDGARVNANIYDAKEDVYLNGGPNGKGLHVPAGLPEGEYFFQVTDPSGGTLLSSDAIECRRVAVERGVIARVVPASGCEHLTGADAGRHSTTVQLMPYRNTPNHGGEYKVWFTPVVDFGLGNRTTFGFVEKFSKTDNFKIKLVEAHPVCGNEVREPGEGCDDGNRSDGDGCSAICQPEPPPPPAPCCGDGHVDAGEGCDDGNTVDGDGCSATCTVETPPPPPAGCCGDGHMDEGEQCDDGNTVDGDGCSATCTTEPVCEPTT